jgi:hypothetical protein
MPDAFDRYFTAIGRRVEDYLDLQKLEPSYRVFFKTEKSDKGGEIGQKISDIQPPFQGGIKGGYQKLEN